MVMRVRALPRCGLASGWQAVSNWNNHKTRAPWRRWRRILRTLRAPDGTIAYEDYLGNSFNVSVDQLAFLPTRHEAPKDNIELEAHVVLSRADSGANDCKRISRFRADGTTSRPASTASPLAQAQSTRPPPKVGNGRPSRYRT